MVFFQGILGIKPVHPIVNVTNHQRKGNEEGLENWREQLKKREKKSASKTESARKGVRQKKSVNGVDFWC